MRGDQMKKSRQKPGRSHPAPRSANDSPKVFGFSRISAAAVLALVAFFFYVNSVEGKFVFDDTVIIRDNESIRGLDAAHLKEIFGQHYWKSVETSGGLYRPLVSLSYALNHAMGGNSPTGYHLLNVLFHVINGVLVFFVMEALFSRRALSFLTALFFILHPIRTEAVASIVGRAESLSAVFALAAWFFYIRHRQLGQFMWLWLSAAGFVLAVLSKESAYAFLALVPLTDYILQIGKPHQPYWNRMIFLRYAPFALATILTLGLRYWILGGLAPLYINPGSNPLGQVTAWPRFLTATHVFGRYLSLLIWPVNLSADYSYNQIPVLTTISSLPALIPVLMLLCILGGLAVSARRQPILFFSGIVFFSTFILTSNWIRPIGTIMGERLMYFPALGFNCAVAYLLCSGLSMARWRTLASVLIGVILVGYGFLTLDRNRDWRDHYSLFGSAVRVSPESYLVQSNYATIILNEKKDAAGAVMHARKALQIKPQDPASYYTLGQALHRLGDLPAAVEALQTVARLAPRTSGAAEALAEEAGIEETRGNYAQARDRYETLRDWQPSNISVQLALARVYARLGETARAREYVEHCLKLAPNDPAVKAASKAYGLVR